MEAIETMQAARTGCLHGKNIQVIWAGECSGWEAWFMTIKYRSNLAAGCISIVAAIVLFFLIPAQIGKDFSTTYGITSRTVPYAVSALWLVCGIVLIVQSLAFGKDTEKTLVLSKELKALAYMALLVVYAFFFEKSFLISTLLLGFVTLGFTGCKKPLYYGVVSAVVALLYCSFTFLLHVQMP